MIYTRHFYRIDEVKAALQYEIHNKHTNEAFFWLTELIDSDEFELIDEVLIKSWFYDIGLANLNILYAIILASKDEERLYEIVYAMIYVKRDCTLPILFLYGIANNVYKNKNVVFNLPSELVQEDKMVDTFIRACILGKYLEAWFLSIALWENKSFNFQLYIERIIKYKFKSPIYLQIINFLKYIKYINIWYIRCIIVGILCYTEKDFIHNYVLKKIDVEYKNKIQQLSKLIGRRERREFAIPDSCLYGLTYRGTQTFNDNNINELYNPEILMTNQKIYEAIIELHGSYENFLENDDVYEEFMDSYFPDDVPDEWSLIDQKKSHGIGVNQETDKPNIRRYFNRWIELKNNCKIWDKETIVSLCLDSLQTKFKSFYIEKEIFDIYDKKANILNKEQNTWDMRSMKLILSALEEE